MIKELKFGNEEWKREKKLLEGSGHRHANYWARHARITADELRKYAMNGAVDALRVYIDGTTKLYYTREAVEAVLKILGR